MTVPYHLDLTQFSLERFRRALETRENILGPENPDAGETLRAYAGLLRELGREAEAAETASRADRILAGIK